jgi:hypothetical protein
MGASTAEASNARLPRGRSLIALFTTLAALTLGACAFAAAPAVAYEQSTEGCVDSAGESCAEPGLPGGDVATGDAAAEDDSSVGTPGYDQLVDQPPADSKYVLASNDQKPADSWSKLPFPTWQELQDKEWQKANEDWEKWVTSRANDTLAAFDPDHALQDAHHCEKWSDGTRCGLFWITTAQRTTCQGLADDIQKNGATPAQGAFLRECDETAEDLDETLLNWINVRRRKRHEEEISRRHQKHQSHRARKSHRGVRAEL